MKVSVTGSFLKQLNIYSKTLEPSDEKSGMNFCFVQYHGSVQVVYIDLQFTGRMGRLAPFSGYIKYRIA